MTTTINASPTNGLVQTADSSGIIKIQSNGSTTNALAWVNFNGTGTVAIRSAYNVSSITDNGTGDYTVNFTNALSDADYSTVAGSTIGNAAVGYMTAYPNAKSSSPFYQAPTTSSVRIVLSYGATSATLDDSAYINVAIFGN